MLVEEIMKTQVITLSPDASIKEALQLLHHHHIRHIPIVNKEGLLTGIVSDRDVRDASPSVFDKNTEASELENPIKSIMSQPVVTIHPLDVVEDIASIFYEEEFACLPVVSQNKLVGIVTEKDMLYTLIQLTGTNIQSSQIEVKVPHRAGILPEVAHIFGKRNVNINSILVYPYNKDEAYKILVFRFQTMNPLPIIDDIKKAGFDVLWPNSLEQTR